MEAAPPFLRPGFGRLAGRVILSRPAATITLSGPAVGAGIPGHGAWVELAVATHDWQGRPGPDPLGPGLLTSKDLRVRGRGAVGRLRLRLRTPVPVPRVRVGSAGPRVVAFRFAPLAGKAWRANDGTQTTEWVAGLSMDMGGGVFKIWHYWNPSAPPLAQFRASWTGVEQYAFWVDVLFACSSTAMVVYSVPDGRVMAEFYGDFGRGAVVSPSGHRVVYRRATDRQWACRDRRDGFAVERQYGAPVDHEGRALTAAGEFLAYHQRTAVRAWTEDGRLRTVDYSGVGVVGVWIGSPLRHRGPLLGRREHRVFELV